MKEYIQSLSSEQLLAVTHRGNVLVTAIPGSGKTRTLINKIVYEYNNESSNIIVAITFTRRAADEVEDRIREQIGEIPSNIWVGTIHKFCLDFIVRGYGSYSKNFSKNFQIISEPDQEKIKNKLKEKYKVGNFTPIDYTLNIFGGPNEKIFIKLVTEYYDIMLNQNKIDFDYILYESYRLLHTKPFIANQLSILIKSIFIDEYQDTQELQYQILSLIAKKNKTINVFIVGDSNQAIYEGIGGVVKTKQELDKIFDQEFTELHLIGCYRSNQKIIDFYKNFAVKDFDMKSLTMKWRKPSINIYTQYDKKTMFNKVFRIIKNLIEEGYKENEIAIVAPQWHQLYEITNEIKKALPDIKFDAPNLVPLKKDEDGIIHKFCRLLLTNFDYFNIYRIKRLSYEIIHQFEEEYGYVIDINVISFLNIINSSKTTDTIGTEYLKNSLKRIFIKLNLFEQFKNDIDEFILGTKERIQHFQKQGLEDEKLFFEQSLRSKSGVVISSFHGIKGEEYAVVIAFGLLEGYIPHWNDIINKGESVARLNSKKLLFVISSRAKEKIYFFAENDRKTQKGKTYLVNKEIKQVYCKIHSRD